MKTHIRAATEKVKKPWVRSAFVDNAGIVQFDDQYDLAFKVETHNHPSALEPFGGANTGVSGLVRDVVGVSARPIANTDVLCFGPQDLPLEALPAGVLHPRRIASGVIAGIEDYGNKMGIPTVTGAAEVPGPAAMGDLAQRGAGAHGAGRAAGQLATAAGSRADLDVETTTLDRFTRRMPTMPLISPANVFKCLARLPTNRSTCRLSGFYYGQSHHRLKTQGDLVGLHLDPS